MQYHFIGIKGSGMASLATILKDQGQEVQGSDIEKYIFTQQPLEERKIPILTFAKENVPSNSIVIIGNAFDEEHEEVKQARSMPSVTCYRYHEYLGKLMEDYCSISVAGTHGKTTTTGMLSHVLSYQRPCGYLIGDGTGAMPKHAHYFVVESCEYQRHFLAYQPDYAIITNMELDHVDYYHDMKDYRHAFQSFVSQVKKGVVLFGDDPEVRSLAVDIDHLYYGLHEGNDIQAKNINAGPDGMSFDVYANQNLFGNFHIPFVGKPFLWNSLGVIAVGIMEGMDAKRLQDALSTFQGVKRRFHEEVQGDNVYIDDYAHHPTAVSLTIEAAKMKYPKRKVIAIFKPDRFSRIAYFLHEFAKALDQADDVYLCEFPENAKKEDDVDVTIQDLCALSKKGKVIQENEEGAAILAQQSPAVYLFMSSKDIYKLKNIVKSFQ